MFTRKILALGFAVTLLVLTGRDATAEVRTTKIIVPMAPGGAVDFVARVLAEAVGRINNQAVVVETRPGAGSVVGTEVATRATADGHTVLINAGGNLLIPPQLHRLNYDPLTSLKPICKLVTVPDIIAVNGNSSYRTLADLIGAARAKPYDVSMASLGPATDLQVAVEKLMRTADVHMTFVPYPGVAPAISALLGQQVSSVLTSYSSAAQQIKAGTLRALAATTGERIRQLPDVPTVAESGYRDYGVEFWFGLFAPANTPKRAIDQLAAQFAEALRSPEVKARLDTQGLLPAVMCGADFAEFVREQYAEFGRVIREANLKAE